MFLDYSIFKNCKVQVVSTTKEGGTSSGNYEAMNLCNHSGDEDDKVNDNRRILMEKLNLPIDNLYIPFQTHEDKVALVDDKFLTLSGEEKKENLYGVDALITKEKQICIGVTTADCVPLIIYDPINHALGVAHAGWKGTVSHIGYKTVEKMVRAFSSTPSSLLVAIGPSISQEMFEVGDEVGDTFVKSGFHLEEIAYRKQDTGKLHIDLWKANLLSLLEAGIAREHIEIAGICTYKSENYFSARRQTIRSGRMFSGGVLQ